jgi:hypothetical protein
VKTLPTIRALSAGIPREESLDRQVYVGAVNSIEVRITVTGKAAWNGEGKPERCTRSDSPG